MHMVQVNIAAALQVLLLFLKVSKNTLPQERIVGPLLLVCRQSLLWLLVAVRKQTVTAVAVAVAV